MTLGEALGRALLLPTASALTVFIYTSHSSRIGGYNELLNLRFPKEWIMRRLDYESEQMLRV